MSEDEAGLLPSTAAADEAIVEESPASCTGRGRA
jgi:hypothetical protein